MEVRDETRRQRLERLNNFCSKLDMNVESSQRQKCLDNRNARELKKNSEVI